MTDEVQTEVTPETEWTDTDTEVTTIEETKEQLAEMYLNFLDKQKGWILETGVGLGVSLNPLHKDAIKYLTTDAKKEKTDFFSTIEKNIKKKFIEKLSWWTLLEYDKASLNKMKALINQYKNDKAKLEELMAQIEEGTDPTIIPTTETTPIVTPTAAIVVWAGSTAVESAEKMTDRRKAVIANINAILKQDKNSPIRYNWGGRKSIKEGVDCSWLVLYALQHAWLKVGGNSRSMFKTFSTKKLDVDEEGAITTDTSDIMEWDVIFWDSLDTRYARSTWEIPQIEKDWKKYRIHHVAFVKSIDRAKGIVHTVESNGSKWVTEGEVNVAKLLTKKGKKNSALYVAHMDYDALEKMDETAMNKLEVLPWAKVVA